MALFVVPVEGKPAEVTIISAVGFTPHNALALAPEGASLEDGPFVELVDGKYGVNQGRKAAAIALAKQQAALREAAEKAKADAIEQAQARIDSLDLVQRLASASTVAQIKSVLQDVLGDLITLRKR